MSDRDRDIKSPLSEALVDRRPAAKAARETPVWEHAPAAPMRVPGGAPAGPQGPYRGRGPRGYARSPARIYEDLCDRLTESPFIDATDIEVTVAGTEVTRSGEPGIHIPEARVLGFRASPLGDPGMTMCGSEEVFIRPGASASPPTPCAASACRR